VFLFVILHERYVLAIFHFECMLRRRLEIHMLDTVDKVVVSGKNYRVDYGI
jgi:hypothetical protein